MRSIYRTAIPVDDQVHPVDMAGPILHVATRNPQIVEVWHLHNREEPVRTRWFRVYGTGQPIETPGPFIGTAIVPSGSLVWHLMEQDNPHAA